MLSGRTGAAVRECAGGDRTGVAVPALRPGRLGGSVRDFRAHALRLLPLRVRARPGRSGSGVQGRRDALLARWAAAGRPRRLLPGGFGSKPAGARAGRTSPCRPSSKRSEPGLEDCPGADARQHRAPPTNACTIITDALRAATIYE